MEEETTTPLAARPEELHAEVAADANHLEEVRQRHTFHLVTAGMLPESHLANIEPERRLAWMVEELHGRSDPDGLTLPMAGVADAELTTEVIEGDQGSMLRIKIEQDGAPTLERELPLAADAKDVKHHFVDGHLVVRW
jgi:6-phosphogluconolactonase/glucosamine-6-phosphate isomerase/deaminase